MSGFAEIVKEATQAVAPKRGVAYIWSEPENNLICARLDHITSYGQESYQDLFRTVPDGYAPFTGQHEYGWVEQGRMLTGGTAYVIFQRPMGKARSSDTARWRQSMEQLGYFAHTA